MSRLALLVLLVCGCSSRGDAPASPPQPPPPAQPPPVAKPPHTTPRNALDSEITRSLPRHGMLSITMGLASSGPSGHTLVYDADAGTFELTVLNDPALPPHLVKSLTTAERARLTDLGARAAAAEPLKADGVTDYREAFVVADGEDTFALDQNAPINVPAIVTARAALEAFVPPRDPQIH